MVTSVTNLSRNGLRDWLIQRLTSVILGAYFLFLLIYTLCHPGMNFVTWSNLFASTSMRIFTLLALVSMACHAWIGIWTITTDYITERMQGRKALFFRLLVQIFFALVLIVYLIWGVQIVWGL